MMEKKRMTDLQRRLMELQDENYREFHAKLIPNIDKSRIIGIRTPELRKFAKLYAHEPEAKNFLRTVPHDFYEEDNLHMMLVTQIADFDVCMRELKAFLPYVDNWATCDLPQPKCLREHRDALLPEIRRFLASGQTYTIRYGIGLLMNLYLDEEFSPEYPELVASVQSEEYYVNMMIAWYFATALAKRWKDVILYLENRRLAPWTHRKTIQKAVESYRITDEQKAYLRGLR